MSSEIYLPHYSAGHALIVGINTYRHASPLGYAVSDAEALAELLKEKFEFPSENITVLTDKRATRRAILKSFLSYVQGGVERNDRIIVFFAGHGYTHTGGRREVGYLIPYDGNTNDLSTLLRWDDLTRNAELIPAKHIFFIMDACYGGLAITRSLSPGSARFLKDMMCRYSRQVLTAGKADEVVADLGGPLPSHSIFTGHLLEALNGKAAARDGIITANGVMSYVYEKVAKDHNSHQTPHYGFIEGDGDFIFQAPVLESLQIEDRKGEDVLISIPAVALEQELSDQAKLVEITKEYLSDTKHKIKLDDLVTKKVRTGIRETSEESFPVGRPQFSVDELVDRLRRYEQIITDLQAIACCMSYWGDEQHRPILKKLIARLTDSLGPQSGVSVGVWFQLRWYPVMLLFYGAGISAVAAGRYENLATILTSKVVSTRSVDSSIDLVSAIGEVALELERMNVFKQLPGHERYYVPRSEYLFKLSQPLLDDLLFLGRDYEQAFNCFELMFALVHADLREKEGWSIWGPLGRFGWKYHSDSTKNPFKDLMIEASRQKEAWEPLRAGLFGGDYSRFEFVASEYEKLIAKLNWW